MAEEVIPYHEHFYILSTSSRIDDRTRVLKHGDTFAVFDRFGDMERYGTGELGLYHQDTRFVSRLTLKLEDERPLLLSSTVKDDKALLAVDATNPDIRRDGVVVIPRGTVHVFRSRLLWNETCYERIRIHNYGRTPVELAVSLSFASDFADIFEVRGAKREKRGRRLPPEVNSDRIILAYEGLDHRVRRTRIALDPEPESLTDAAARYDMALDPDRSCEYRYAIRCEVLPAVNAPGRRHPRPPRYDEALEANAASFKETLADTAAISTGNDLFNDLLNRSLVDLTMMRVETPHGPYPYAGVPWYCTAFGRDGIITALECLSFNPSYARGVLGYLAATQARTTNAEQDAEPGKILHETREGEMAIMREVPFHRYYGSVDATPLFVMLAGAYFHRTGDVEYAATLWPHVTRALDWMDTLGDRDGDGFVEYARTSQHGLTHQGWKDSSDAVFHDNGELAEGPIALCEVQGYVYAARRAAAEIAAAIGDNARAQRLADAADALRPRFQQAFWCDDLGVYAIAMDGGKKLCRVRTSNPGHCLYAGIASVECARRITDALNSDVFFSGWGIRTVAEGEARYNPMSYHNGSVWPHDNALIAAGFARYGYKDAAARVLTGLLDASTYFDQNRLPELFCGFERREAPTPYPVACSPQSWASAAVFLLLESCLGLKIQGAQRRIIFTAPHLPPSLPEVTIRRLRVGDAYVDLLATRHAEGDVSINVLKRVGDIEVVILK